MRIIACAAALALAASGVLAQEAAKAYDLGEIDVAAPAWSPIAVAPAGSVAVVTGDQIEASCATTAADALQLADGAFVSRYGPGAAAATISLRGSSSAQVLVIVDGVRLNDARQGAPDLSSIPADQIEKIEVLRGGASAVYGADAVGGVVLITTKRPSPGKLAVSIRNTSYPTAGSGSSFVDGQRLALEAGAKIGEAELSVSGSGERASGAYAYGGGNTLRDNADLGGASGKMNVGLPLAAGRLRASAFGSYREEGVPGSLSGLSPTEREKDSALRGELGWSSDALAGGNLSMDLLAHGSWTRIVDTLWDSKDELSGAGLDARGTLELASWASLGFGGAASFERADSNTFDSAPGGQPERSSLGAYFEPAFTLGDSIKVLPALRYDWSDDYAAGLTSMLALVWKADTALALRFSAGRSYRAPTFNELYYPFMSNPKLKSESAWNAEAGFSYDTEGLRISASTFARLIDDMILNDAFYIPQNIGRVLSPGADVSLDAGLGQFRIKSDYEFIYPLDLSSGGALADAPLLRDRSMHKASASILYKAGPFEAGMGGRYWSDRRFSDGSSLPGVALLDAQGSLLVSKNAKLSLSAENLLDQGYQVNAGYPMPGLSLTTSLRVEL
jgi:vitamin B12 transporter